MSEPSALRKTAMKNNKHIDDVQEPTVDDHFRILMECDDIIDPEICELGPQDLPGWYDAELFQAGQDYYSKNMLSMNISATVGLLAVLAVPSILKVLIFTKQSGTPCTAFKRYLETIIHTHTLYTADVSDKQSDWWRTANTIRWKHSTSSQRSSKFPSGPIKQRDMTLTQFGFIGYALISGEKLSLTNEPREREGLNHFWRVVGHILGISDRINLCRKNEKETTTLCRKLVNEVWTDYMRKEDLDFRHMSSVLIDGLWSLDVLLNEEAMLSLWYRLSELEYTKPISAWGRFIIHYQRMLFYILGIPYLGALVRSGFNQYLRFNYWLAQRCPLIAWIRFGKSKTTINLYPKLLKE